MEPSYNHPEVIIPFRHKERNGRVVVSYGKVEDPVQTGFDWLAAVSSNSLAALGFDINLTRGYPMMHAQIDYEGSGYRTSCGWVQVVTGRWFDSYDEEAEPVEQSVSVDLPHPFQNLELPFAAYGNLPQLFDAPCLNLDQHARREWVADTFLTTIPARSRDEEITWLLGFRWGYIEYDTPEQKPVILLPLEVTAERDWNAHLSLLADQFPSWRFGKAGPI